VPSQSERDRLLEQQAVERAELESRQRSELTRIHSADSGQQLQRRQAQEQAELTRRHQAELQSLDRKRRA
jgi:hypothetical protein